MRFRILASATALLLCAGTVSAQVNREHFLLRTTSDLIVLCSVSKSDPNAAAAIHFCHGYLVGLDHFAEATGRPFRSTLYCPPEGLKLTRDQEVSMALTWLRNNPQHHAERPFDSIIRWAAATWPCKK
jgi:hypothetical protein